MAQDRTATDERSRIQDFENMAVYGFIIGLLENPELTMNVDLVGDGEITATKDMTLQVKAERVRRQDPNKLEVRVEYTSPY